MTTTEPHRESEQNRLKIHALDPRRKSVLILATLLTAIAASSATATLSVTAHASPSLITTLQVTAILSTLVALYIIARLGARITQLEFWIRRMGAGDLDHTVPPRGHDELTEIAYDLEVLRQRSIRSEELDLVRELSEQLQDKNAALKSTLEELRDTQDQVVSRQKLAEIGELAAGIAHEVRNPLNIISNYSATSRSLMEELLEVLGEEGTDPKEREEAIQEVTADLKKNMSRIAENCDRASRIIQDVTNMSRSGPSEQRPVDLNKLLHDYAILAYQAARAQDQNFNVSIVEELDPDAGEITCVPEEISRVFVNIASNACYATNQKRLGADAPDDYRPIISLTTHRRADNAVITIRDNGNGIPEEDSDKIFRPFFTTKPTNEGTGLGLSLSHEIIRHHGGTIAVASRPGEYTEMTVTLPVRPTQAAPGKENEPATSAQ